MNKYNHKEIEKKWRDRWEAEGVNKVLDNVSGKENYYTLVEFPYPSGNLHIGHWYAFAVTDVFARFKRMQGYNVLFPVGFDAFGLPAENAAIKHKLNPRDWTYKNIDYMRNQIKSMGAMFDWDREIATCDPEYYKWTQWLFIKFYENGLVKKRKTLVNWDPVDKTILANEQVLADGTAERSGAKVEKKELDEWSITTTKYADELIDDLDKLDWPKEIKESQKNWIGRSEGVEVDFKLFSEQGEKEIIDLKVFTTRVDTIFGVTYLVIAPEYKNVESVLDNSSNRSEVEEYINESKNKDEIERTSTKSEKTGIKIDGVYAINPVNKEKIPVFVADYVLGNYGTGAVMAVPAHDERDNQFAKKYDLPIKDVVIPKRIDFNNPHVPGKNKINTEKGVLVDSGKYSDLSSDEAVEKMVKDFGFIKKKNYKLRDWSVSRQRYWGCPIPMINCPKCGPVPVAESDLPVVLPETDDYLPRDDGKSPLSKVDSWMNVNCPKCNGEAQREAETLDTFVDSSWYYLRYCDPKNTKEFANPDTLKSWMPVNFYSGGAEHTTMHLLYARFFAKAMSEIGLIDFNEPFLDRLNRGLILGTDGNKMSKSKGNVIDPDKEVENVGADAVRCYLSFIGPYNEYGTYPWDPNGLVGVKRFLERAYGLKEKIQSNSADFTESSDFSKIQKSLHKTIKKVTEDCARLKFNTALSTLMIFVNETEKTGLIREQYLEFLKLLSVFAPFISEEIWYELDNKNSIHLEDWPKYDESLIQDDKVRIIVQVNGKVRANFEAETGIDESEALEKAKALPEILKWLEDKEVVKEIYIAGKLVNIVVK